VATLDANHTRPSKGIKRKHEDDNNLLAVFQSLLAHVADGDEDEITTDDSSDKDHEEGTSWINHWIDKPLGERGRKNSDTRPGWGKPEIMKTAGITEEQYNRYMVSFLVVLVVEPTDSFQ